MKARREMMNEKLWLSLLLLTLLIAASGCKSGTPPANTPNATANNASAPAASNANGANAPAASNANPATGGNVATGAPKSPLDGIVKASAEPVEVRAGGTADTAVRLSIASGYHVNANPATERFLISTALAVKPEEDMRAEKIAYPKPLTKKFAFAEVPLAVYEGDASITFTIRAARNAEPGQRSLAARVRVQPCDDEKCYPPMTVETSIPITIR